MPEWFPRKQQQKAGGNDEHQPGFENGIHKETEALRPQSEIKMD